MFNVMRVTQVRLVKKKHALLIAHQMENVKMGNVSAMLGGAEIIVRYFDAKKNAPIMDNVLRVYVRVI